MSDKPLVSVVIPTKNSGETIETCLKSIKEQTYPNIEVVVVDSHSNDGTKEISEGFSVEVMEIKVGRSRARNIGAKKAGGALILSLDSDMELTSRVVEECINKVEEGHDAIIIPEMSVGIGFWAKCKVLEKSCYVGDEVIESSRFVKRDVFETVGGYDPKLEFAEDQDFNLRIMKAGYRIGRINALIKHLEGRLILRETILKHYHYGKTLKYYRIKHPEEAKQLLRLIRPAFVKNWKKLARDPVHAAGMLFMKACEFFSFKLSDLWSTLTHCENQRNSRTETVVKLTDQLCGKLNLDAGCGKGRNAECFKGNIIGLDLNLRDLTTSKEKYDALILGSVCHLPFKSYVFDFVLCSEVIEHIPKLDGGKALKELERVTDFLLITTPNRNKLFQILSLLTYGPENPEHMSRWSPKEFKEKMFDVYGCLSWVTAEKIPKTLQKLWNIFAWYIVEIFGGDVIAMKSKSNNTFKLFMKTWQVRSKTDRKAL